MPIRFPTRGEIVSRSSADLKAALPESAPNLFGSFIRAIVIGVANRSFDLVGLFRQIEPELFPTTATGEFLERAADYEGLTRSPAVGATGNIIIIGSTGTVVDANTILASTDGIQFETAQSVTLSTVTSPITTLTRSGSTATAVTTSPHQFASNMTVNISGVTETEYAGDKVITVVNNTTFTYDIVETASPTASGTPVASVDGAIVEVNALTQGSNTNLAADSTLTFTATIAGANRTAFVILPGISGGLDIENDEDLRVRVLQSRQNPVANFNEAAIEREARRVPGVTRVSVKPITRVVGNVQTTPSVGDVTIFFLRDDDPDIIPSATEVAAVRNQILTILPATSDPDNVFVLAPTPVETDYTISSVVPATETMRDAVRQSILAFYEDNVEFEEDIQLDPIRGAIQNTIDPATGQEITSFVLTAPSATISIDDNEIGRPGTITVT